MKNADLTDFRDWKYLTYTSTFPITLPTDYNELYIFVSNNSVIGGTLVIPKIAVDLLSSSGTEIFIGGGYFGTSNHAFVNAIISPTQIKQGKYYINGNAQAYVVGVYYR